MEVWKDIPGYEGIYQASNHGRIRSTPGKTTHSILHGKRVWKSRILKNKIPNGREKRVTLWKNKQPKDFLVHRLVATTFIPMVEGKNCINHKDGNPHNNHITNLEWCDHKENNNHAFETGLISTGKKTTLILDDGRKKTFRSMSKASEFLGLNNGAVSNARNRNQNKVNGVRFIVGK